MISSLAGLWLIRVPAAYFLAVQRETAAVRLILAGKQNGFDAENIRERLRDLYV